MQNSCLIQQQKYSNAMGLYFAYGGPRYIDARCHDDICDCGGRCHCIPPEERILPPEREYDCRPVSPRFSPPIGPRLMMDYFTNPDSINPGHRLVLDQLPKRMYGGLGSQGDRTEAWGIYFKEGWDWVKIWWILAASFFPLAYCLGFYGESSRMISRARSEWQVGG